MLSDKNLKAFVSTTKPELAKVFYRDPHPFTILGWNVPDIASAIKSLTDKKMAFEKYDFLEQDNLGIWTSPSGAKVAWFKDPDRNVLSLTQ